MGSTSSLWGGHHDIEWAIKRIAWLGLQGIEPYPQQIEKYRSDPRPLNGFDAIGGNMDLAVDDYIAHNINCLRVILGVRLPPLG